MLKAEAERKDERSQWDPCKKLHVLLLDNNSKWIPTMKKGLELSSSELRVTLAETEAEAIRTCVNEQSQVVILDSSDFQSTYLIKTLRGLPGERLYLLLVWAEDLLAQRKIHQAADDVLLLLRPCSFNLIYENIRTWVYGRKLTISNDICAAYLERWGFSSFSLGFTCLCDALAEYSMERRLPLKAIYTTLAKRFNSSERNIQNAVRSAVRKAWNTHQMSEEFNHLPNSREILSALCKELDKRT